MSRSNKKNRRLNKKKKNVGRNQGETSTTPVVDHSVEVPRADRAETGNDYTDHTEPTGNLWGDRNVSAKEAGTSEKEIKQSTENEIDTKVTSVYNETSISCISNEIEQQDSDLKGKPHMDLQSNEQLADDDATSITEPSNIQRKGRAWTSCLCCCGVLDILRAIIKGACS